VVEALRAGDNDAVGRDAVDLARLAALEVVPDEERVGHDAEQFGYISSRSAAAARAAALVVSHSSANELSPTS
jgi:hypothetical protein